jgi:gamma-glutamyltranspeptidase / glutathione hydrolase
MRRLLLTLLGVLALLSAPALAKDQRDPAKSPTATGSGGAASTVDAVATRAAIETLRKGGNAVDAAVVAAAVLGVTEPYSCGIGGGGFMVIRQPDGAVTTVDGREKAPAAYTETTLEPYPGAAGFAKVQTSGLSVGVPGTVEQWDVALRRFGTLSLREAVKPAEQVARRGFVVDQTFFDQTQANRDRFARFPATAALFLDPDGTPRDVGTTLRNPDLARTYRLIGKGGADAFYEGAIADAIVRTVRDPQEAPGVEPSLSGPMTRADLEAYTAPLRAPVTSEFQGLEVHGMAPPSSGGTTVAEILNIYESGGFKAADRDDALHRFIEAARLAYADRNAFVGDPDFVQVPTAGLISESFAAERAALIGETAFSGTRTAGNPGAHPKPGATVERSQSTTHLTVADAQGRVVSYTFTIEATGGSGITVPGFGFLLNNELTDFNFQRGTANSPAGGKRPRSSMAPTIVERGGQPFLAVGSPGGATIITTVAQVLLDRIALGRPLPEAVAAPRLSQRNGGATQGETGFPSSPEAQALAARGHTFTTTAEIGAFTGIEHLGGGGLLAVAEPARRGGGAAEVVRRPGARGGDRSRGKGQGDGRGRKEAPDRRR